MNSCCQPAAYQWDHQAVHLDTSTAPDPIPQDGVKSPASIDKLRTLSLSKCSIKPEQIPGFSPEKVELAHPQFFLARDPGKSPPRLPKARVEGNPDQAPS
jgi:hypothetical protein